MKQHASALGSVVRGAVLVTLAIGVLWTSFAACSSSQEGDCSSDQDCGVGESCVPPFAPVACGACRSPERPCSEDDDCIAIDAHSICAPVSCACDAAASECVSRCTDDSACIRGEACASDGRCAPIACGSGSDCPAQFDCAAGADGAAGDRCQRRDCGDDDDCQTDGVCVLGSCHDGAGVCSPPVP